MVGYTAVYAEVKHKRLAQLLPFSLSTAADSYKQLSKDWPLTDGQYGGYSIPTLCRAAYIKIWHGNDSSKDHIHFWVTHIRMQLTPPGVYSLPLGTLPLFLSFAHSLPLNKEDQWWSRFYNFHSVICKAQFPSVLTRPLRTSSVCVYMPVLSTTPEQWLPLNTSMSRKIRAVSSNYIVTSSSE